MGGLVRLELSDNGNVEDASIFVENKSDGHATSAILARLHVQVCAPRI